MMVAMWHMTSYMLATTIHLYPGRPTPLLHKRNVGEAPYFRPTGHDISGWFRAYGSKV